MRGVARSASVLAALWAFVVALSLYARSLMPIDETRYAAVAWEMWNSGDYLVPRLNGEIYSHKPPLLFWLINAAWMVFGVHEWAARLVGPVFALFDLILVGAVARALWPDDAHARQWAGAALLACPVFALYSSLLMFDAMLACFVLIALLGILRLGRDAAGSAVALVAAGIGGGILSKGPVVLVYVLPVALAAPWWSPALRGAWKRFAAMIALGVAAGATVAMAWAVPAAIFGGPEYREAILWTQTAGRVTQAFDHGRPFWYYLALLPAILFPLAYLVPLRPIFARDTWRDEGLRFCAAWCLGSLAALSLISGKQAHYLVPLLPAAALIASRIISRHADAVRRPTLVAAVYALGAAAAAGAAFTLPANSFPRFDAGLGGLALMTAAGVAGAAMFFFRRPARHVMWWAAACSGLVLGAFQWMIGPGLSERYDTAPFAGEVAKRLDAGFPLVHHGEYRGQFHFTGRLTQPLPVLKKKEALAVWCAEHPEGYVIWYWKAGGEEPFPGRMESAHPFRGKTVGLVRAETVIARE